MTDERESREHDHLVEPLFAALGEVPEAKGRRDLRRRRALLSVLVLLVALALLIVIASR